LKRTSAKIKALDAIYPDLQPAEGEGSHDKRNGIAETFWPLTKVSGQERESKKAVA